MLHEFFTNLVKKSYNSFLTKTLLNLLTKSTKLKHYAFWFLKGTRDFNNRGTMNTTLFLNNFDKETLEKLTRDHDFFLGLIKNLSDVKRYLILNIDKYSPITLPYDSNYYIVGADIDNIIIKKVSQNQS